MRRGLLIGAAVLVVAGVGVYFLTHQGATTALDDALAHLPPGYAASHGGISINPITGAIHLPHFVLNHDGQPVYSADDMTVSGIGALDADGIPVRVGHLSAHGVQLPGGRRIERVDLDDIEVHAVRALFDPASYPGGKPAGTSPVTLLGGGDLAGFSAHIAPPPAPAPGVPVDVDAEHVHISGLAARPLAVPPAPQGPQPRGFGAAVAAALAVDETRVDHARLVFAGGTIAGIGSEIVRGYNGGLIDHAEIDDTTVTAPDGRGGGGLHRIAADQLDFGRLLARLAKPAPRTAPHRRRRATPCASAR